MRKSFNDGFANLHLPLSQSQSIKMIMLQIDELKTHPHSETLWARVFHKRTHAQRDIYAFVDSPPVQVFLVSLLFISLFMTDAWILGNQPDSNNGALWGTLMGIFITFCLECITLFWTQKGYIASIFFPLDMLGTISIILDIGWISSSFLGGGAALSNGAVLRSTRAAKLGARYGRLMRILKLTRFLRHLPCFKTIDAPEPAISHVRKVTTVLIARLSQHIAAVIMIAVIVVPFMSYSPQDNGPDLLVKEFKLAVKANTTWTQLNSMVVKAQGFYEHKGSLTKIRQVQIYSPYLTATATHPLTWTYNTRATLRADNLVIYQSNFKSPASFKSYFVKVVMDMTEANQQDAMLGILLVIMVIILLVGISSSLQVNVDSMVVAPLEKMTNKLMGLGTDMLKSWKASLTMSEKENNEVLDEDEDDLEDLMLERMIEKIAKLADMHSEKHEDIELSDVQGLDEATRADLSKSYSRNKDTASNEYRIEEVNESSTSSRLNHLRDSFKTVPHKLLNSWDFDVLDYSHEQLIDVFLYLYDVIDAYESFQLPKPVLAAFLRDLATRYVNTNTYHNFHHGCDVAHTVYRLVTVPSLHLAFSHLEVFSIITAALAHDVGHPGLNNVYLVKAKHKLALTHNDSSPLENMHCSVLYSMLSKAKTNVFVGLTDAQWRESRKLIITAILGTDMSHHFNSIKQTKIFGELNGASFHSFTLGESSSVEALNEEKNRTFLLELCLHCADISNPFKSWKVCERWASLVIEEFCLQGDREKSQGLEISPMCDRATINLCNSQLGFIEFVVAPLIIGACFSLSLLSSSFSNLCLLYLTPPIAFVQIFPPLYEIGENVCNNFVNWAERRKEDINADAKIEDKAGERAKVDDKIKGFRERFAFTAELRHKCEEAGLISPECVLPCLLSLSLPSLSLSLSRVSSNIMTYSLLSSSTPPSLPRPLLCSTSMLHTDEFGQTARGHGLRRVSTYQSSSQSGSVRARSDSSQK